MKTKNKLIEDLQFYIFNYNEYWEDPIEKSNLIDNTKETCEEIISCCNFIKIKIKNLHKGNFKDYPLIIRDHIQNIINLVCDDRILREKVIYKHVKGNIFDPIENHEDKCKEYDHHVEENGYLSFKNDPTIRLDQIIETCNELIEVVNSYESTKNLSKFIGKYLYWNNYESGGATIRIDKINKNSKGKYTFDGLLITDETVNGHTDMDGVLMQEVEDLEFDSIPYTYLEIDDDDENQFIEILENAEELTWNKLKKIQ